jgi:hypothetical protein
MSSIIQRRRTKGKSRWIQMPPWAAAFLAICLPAVAHATIYEVGPGQPYPTIASVPNPSPGDIVDINCGTYNEVRNWTSSGTSSNPITLQGVCPSELPVVDGTNQNLSGNGGYPRAVWQMQGAYYVIQNLAFIHGTNQAEDAAGIRVMNTGVTISNVNITYCDMGLMTSTANATNLLVQYSEIAFNGSGKQNGQTHNVYLTDGDNITFQFSYIHDAVSGTNFKTRSQYTQLLYSYIAYGDQNEVDSDDGPGTGNPNSNLTMIGNIVVSKPNRTLNKLQFICFGQDVGGLHNGTLYLINNTLVAGASSIGFLRSTATDSAIAAVNNIFYGSNTIVQPGYGNGISGNNNWLPSTAAIPATFTSNTTGTNPEFVNPGQNNYQLMAGSSALGIGYSSPIYVDGNGVQQSGVEVYEYVYPLGGTLRPPGPLDAGAY